MAQKLYIRNGTAAEWVAANPVLSQSEMGHENDTNLFKFGDGVTAWNDLEYYSGIRSDFPKHITKLTRTTSTSAITTWTAINWDTEIFDTDNAFNISNPTRITVPIGMTKIQIKAYALWSNSSTGGRYISIRKNNTNTIHVALQPAKAESGHTIDTGWMSCTEGDYFEFVVTTDTSGITLKGTDATWGGGSWIEAIFD